MRMSKPSNRVKRKSVIKKEGGRAKARLCRCFRLSDAKEGAHFQRKRKVRWEGKVEGTPSLGKCKEKKLLSSGDKQAETGRHNHYGHGGVLGGKRGRETVNEPKKGATRIFYASEGKAVKKGERTKSGGEVQN